MEADIPGGSGKKNDEWVIEIIKMVERPEIEPSKQCRIYEVPHPLRKWNEEAYTPQVVSIGPFHHKNERLKAMEEHKERYFRSFVKRSAINSESLVGEMVGEIRKMEESIRGCNEETINLNSDCDDPVFVQPRFSSIRLDLLLLENQLPFFVIEKLYHLAFSPSDYNLLRLPLDCFSYFNIQRIEAHDSRVKKDSIEHFTDLIRTFQLPPLENLPKRDRPHIKHLYSATQLHEAGVKFESVTVILVREHSVQALYPSSALFIHSFTKLAMSSALSNQSFVHDGTDYEEVYPSGHKDQESLGEERSPFASSSSSTNEDMEMVKQEEVSDDSEEQTLRSVIGTNGLREFIMLPKWTVNNFVSTIKENHFKTLKDNFQIPDNISIRLPYKSERCYYWPLRIISRFHHQVLALYRPTDMDPSGPF
uniref:Uncharacterized protein n=1 Tax=Quercus lobata TaxID=97700 RepID=A0A7N2MS41_QUELO